MIEEFVIPVLFELVITTLLLEITIFWNLLLQIEFVSLNSELNTFNLTNSCRRYMAEILPIRRKTLSNQLNSEIHDHDFYKFVLTDSQISYNEFI